MGVPVATYNAHEHAQEKKKEKNGRDYSPEEAQRYADHFGVDVTWLLLGRSSLHVALARHSRRSIAMAATQLARRAHAPL